MPGLLWVDKHRPSLLEDLDYHTRLSTRLQKVAESGEVPHLMFYGPSGAGKKTRIMALLHAIYGPGVGKVKLERRVFKTPRNRSIDLTTVASNYHIEINPGDAGIYDRFVVQDIIKEIAQSPPLDDAEFKVVLLTEVDSLTRDAQAALRRTMEKYTANCRLILCCQSPSKVIDPVRSRCLGIRVAAPTNDEVVTVLSKVAAKERFNLPEEFAMSVAKAARRNMRRALLMLEACKVQNYPFKPNQTVQRTDWEKFVAGLAKSVVEEQTPARLLVARSKLYELLINCIPPEVIIKSLTEELLPKLDNPLQHELSYWAAHYQHRLQSGQKDIFHLEAFVAKFMAVYKKWLVETFGG